MPRRARDPDGEACGRARHRTALHGHSRQLRSHGEPARLLARAAAAELSLADPRSGSQGVRRREDRRHLRAPGHRRGDPDQVERRGDPDDGGAPSSRRQRADLHEPRRDRLALGPSQRSGQLPPLPAGFRPSPARPARCAAARRSADPHVRPRLRPDDAVDRPLSGARAAAGVCRGAERRRADPGERRIRRRRRHRSTRGSGASPRVGCPGRRSWRRDDQARRAHPAQARWARAQRGGVVGARPRLCARRGAGLPDGGVLHGRLLQRTVVGGDVRPDRCDDPKRRDDRPQLVARAEGGRQALDRRGGRQDVAGGRGRSWRRAACRSGR